MAVSQSHILRLPLFSLVSLLIQTPNSAAWKAVGAEDIGQHPCAHLTWDSFLSSPASSPNCASNTKHHSEFQTHLPNALLSSLVRPCAESPFALVCCSCSLSEAPYHVLLFSTDFSVLCSDAELLRMEL